MHQNVCFFKQKHISVDGALHEILGYVPFLFFIQTCLIFAYLIHEALNLQFIPYLLYSALYFYVSDYHFRNF